MREIADSPEAPILFAWVQEVELFYDVPARMAISATIQSFVTRVFLSNPFDNTLSNFMLSREALAQYNTPRVRIVGSVNPLVACPA